jgi:hypothetical protein
MTLTTNGLIIKDLYNFRRNDRMELHAIPTFGLIILPGFLKSIGMIRKFMEWTWIPVILKKVT